MVMALGFGIKGQGSFPHETNDSTKASYVSARKILGFECPRDQSLTVIMGFVFRKNFPPM